MKLDVAENNESSPADSKANRDDATLMNLDTRESKGEEEEVTKPAPTLIERDRVREYLEKNPKERTEKDIQFLLDFMQHMPAFSNMTMSMRRSLCRVMVFALVEKAGTIVLHDAEKLDSWSVILNGHVEVAKPDGTIQHLHMGDSFGVSSTRDTLLHEGVMATKSDDCQFVCIPQEDFYDILHKEKENIIRIKDAAGEVVMVLEKREIEERVSFVQGKVVLRGTPELLMQQLVDENPMDGTYISDFLLTYRTFMKTPIDLVDYLITCLHTPNHNKAFQVMHAWVVNHFVDYECNVELFGRLEKFLDVLKEKNLSHQITLLHQACSERAKIRQILLVLKNDEEPLQFILAGGQERTSKIFVSHVDEKSSVSKAGLRIADQIISVNNHNLDGITLEKAYEFLQTSSHLVLTVKSNLLDFEKLRMRSASSSSSSSDPTAMSTALSSDQHLCDANKYLQDASRSQFIFRDPEGSISSTDSVSSPLRSIRRVDHQQSPQTSKLRQALGKMNLIQKSETCNETYTNYRASISSASGILGAHSAWNQSNELVNKSSSNSLLVANNKFPSDEVSAIAVYRADQSCRHILVKKSTTIQEAVESLVVEFEIPDAASHYSLCQITLDEEGTIKTKHLPNHLADLAEKCTLNSRYYLRDTRCMERLITGDLNAILTADISFLQLPFSEVAYQLTQRDMKLFRSVDPVEYVNDLFEIAPVPQLSRFSELVNEEMFWVVTDVCSEQNCLKRSKILKQFIKIAERCHKLKNFNSMFAILSGLGHGSVSRLRQTWEKLPEKYTKLFEEMQGIMDLSRNMLKYRNLLLASQPPLIPFFPLVKKDLTFIHFGNDSRIDGLINFDKLRMISKEIRLIFKMASSSSNQIRFQPTKNSMESLISSGSSSSLISVSTTPSKRCTATSLSSASLAAQLAAQTSQSAKKIYEEGQTSRIVKTYIANLKIISDENRLSSMSLICEPDKSTKKVSSSNASVPPLIASDIVGPKFGSESPTAILKLMLLSEGAKPITSINNNNNNNNKPAKNNKNKSKPQLSPLILSKESSSVNIFSSEKSHGDVYNGLRKSKSAKQSSSSSNSSLSLSSTSSSSTDNKLQPPSSKSSQSALLVSATSSERSISATTNSATTQLRSDDRSSASSGIYSILSTSSLHHHHHHLHHHHHNHNDDNVADGLDNLPDDEVDGDDDDDDIDLDFEATTPLLCHDMQQTKIHSGFVNGASNDDLNSSGTLTRPSHPTLNYDPPRDRIVLQQPRCKEPDLRHRHFHRNMIPSSSSSSSSSNQRSSLIPPSYDQLLSMQLNVPSRSSMIFIQGDRRTSARSRDGSPRSYDVQPHSSHCCCSACFQSTYRSCLTDGRGRRCSARRQGNGHSLNCKDGKALRDLPLQKLQLEVTRTSGYFGQHQRESSVGWLPRNHHQQQQQHNFIPSPLDDKYLPYATVKDDEDSELVTLV